MLKFVWIMDNVQRIVHMITYEGGRLVQLLLYF